MKSIKEEKDYYKQEAVVRWTNVITTLNWLKATPSG